MKFAVKIIFILLFCLIVVGCENQNNFVDNKDEKTEQELILYDGLTIDELVNKIEKNLNSTISGYGYIFVSKSLELGLDPYLAVAIMLHETGCKWNCSSLMQKCNNVGGMKGSPGCNDVAYKKFDTLEEGIDSFLSMLYKNYYSKGYTTPEQIGRKYAADPEWHKKVNRYVYNIKNS